LREAVCQKCAKRKTCRTPCRPVELHLADGNLTVFEKVQGDTATLYPRSREAHRSTLSTGTDKAGDPRLSNEEAKAFSTENENPFRHYEANHKQTSVFIKRFFGRWAYEDIAKAHDISRDAAIKIYYAAVQRLLAVIIEMDQVKKLTPEERKRADVAKSKRYLERNREKVNAARLARYARNKEKINAKRRALYKAKKTLISTHLY
jgi:hypothetical protein